MTQPPRSPVQIEAMNPRVQLTREDLRRAPSGMAVMVEEWRRKRIEREAAKERLKRG